LNFLSTPVVAEQWPLIENKHNSQSIVAQRHQVRSLFGQTAPWVQSLGYSIAHASAAGNGRTYSSRTAEEKDAAFDAALSKGTKRLGNLNLKNGTPSRTEGEAKTEAVEIKGELTYSHKLSCLKLDDGNFIKVHTTVVLEKGEGFVKEKEAEVKANLH
jgi:hypothetical protein